MITSVIGRQFLAAYNAAYGLNLSVAEYFEERFIRLFFDHPKYLMEGGNSKLGNGFGKFKTVTREYLMPPYERQVRIKAFLKMMLDNPAGSSPLGYHTIDFGKISSSQVSNVTQDPTTEEAMLSWVGGALSIGVEGGLLILIPIAEVLLKIEEGWHTYRNLQTQQQSLRPNQITTWNGQWLNHYSSLIEKSASSPLPATAYSVDKGVISVATISWVKVLAALTKLINDSEKPITSYVYKLAGKGNTTVGFVSMDLAGFRKLGIFYRRLFGDSEYASNQQLINEVFGSGFGFERACQSGAIGIYALLPEGLKGIRANHITAKKLPKSNVAEKNNSVFLVSTHTYITWLIAMMKDESLTLWARAQEAGELLVQHQGGGRHINTTNANAVNEVIQASSHRLFIEALRALIKSASTSNLDKLENLAQEVDKMPRDNFPYFHTLIKFCYDLANRRQEIALSQTSPSLINV